MLNLTPSVRTIQRVLSNVDWLCYAKLNITLPLSKADKAGRKAWAWKMLMYVEGKAVWEKIIFSDEKNGILTGRMVSSTTGRISVGRRVKIVAVRLAEDRAWCGRDFPPRARPRSRS
jgi:hypothetical protein